MHFLKLQQNPPIKYLILDILGILERFSFAFTANGKRQAAACRKSKKIILF